MKIKIILVFVVLIPAILLLAFYVSTSPAKNKPQAHKKTAAAEKKQAGGEKEPAKEHQEESAKTQQDNKGIVFIEGENSSLPATGEKELAGQIKDAEKKKNAALKTKPDSVTINVRQGAKEKAVFEIANTSGKEAFVNIYKTAPDLSATEIKKRAEEISLHKKSILKKTQGKDALTKATLFNGAPWLTTFPYYAYLKPSESIPVRITVDAKELEEKEYKVFLIALGENEDELLVIPVYIEVGKGPKLRIAKIEIDDGFSPGTSGNKNNIADPGEKITVKLSLKNEGGGDAQNITLTPKPNDSSLKMFDTPIQIPYIASQAEALVEFQAEVDTQANPDIPPALNLTITDGEGVKTVETPYLGDPEKIKYPLGLIIDKETNLEENQE